jgi:hypothetical protein
VLRAEILRFAVSAEATAVTAEQFGHEVFDRFVLIIDGSA